MIAYLFKSVLCSGLLLLIYKLFLEKERMHSFNRAYLLFSIVFSFIAPLIPITVNKPVLPLLENTDLAGSVLPGTLIIADTPLETKTDLLPFAVLILYTLVTLFLLIRFGRNIYLLLFRTGKNPSVPYYGARLVLLPDTIAPHTFLDRIFVNETLYNQQCLEQEILTHELTHVRQKHSLDVLFVEIVRSLAWFNPLLLLYKKAIQLNHEFLADEKVIATYKNITAYQYLLVGQAALGNQYHLSSRLNYLLTKKRLTMMTRSKNRNRELYKKIALVPLFAMLIFLFSAKVYAQVNPASQDKSGKQPPAAASAPGKGVAKEIFEAYNTEVNKALEKHFNEKGAVVYYIMDVTKVDLEKLNVIYDAMSKEQKDKALKLPGFLPKAPPPARKSPTAENLQAWMDPKIYGVWLDGKRISNEELSRYRPADIVFYTVSKLYKNARNYGVYDFHVNLMTASYYETAFLKKKNQN